MRRSHVLNARRIFNVIILVQSDDDRNGFTRAIEARRRVARSTQIYPHRVPCPSTSLRRRLSQINVVREAQARPGVQGAELRMTSCGGRMIEGLDWPSMRASRMSTMAWAPPAMSCLIVVRGGEA